MKKNPNDLRVSASEKKKQADEMQARIDGEDRDWTPDEDAQFKALAKEATDLYDEADAIEKRENDRLAVSRGLDRISTPDGGGRRTQPDKPDAARADVGIPARITAPWYGLDGGANEFFSLVRDEGVSAKQGRRFINEKFDKIGRDFSDIKGAAGANTFNGEDGGFLVNPPEQRDGVIERPRTVIPLTTLVGEIRSVSGNSYEMRFLNDKDASSTSYRYGGVIPYNVDEGGEITASQLKFEKRTLRLHKKGVLCYASQEEMDDTLNFGALLQRKMFAAIEGETIEDIINGDGVNVALGYLNANNGALVSQAIESGQTRATDPIFGENVVKMSSRLLPTGNRGVWLMNPEIYPYVQMATLPGGANRYPMMFPIINGQSDMSVGQMLGAPAYKTDACQAPATAGDIALIDPSQYVLITKGSLLPQIEMSVHVRFVYDESAFRATYRQDGRPIQLTTFTKRRGSLTLGCAVVLAAS